MAGDSPRDHFTMKTYSRRNSRPISRSGKNVNGSSLLLSPSAPSPTPDSTGIRPGDQQTPSSSSPAVAAAAPASAEAVSLEKKRRRLSLASVPVCSLSKLPSPASTPSPAASAGAFDRPSSGGGGGGGVGSPSVLGVRTLWGVGDSLSVGRKRRRPGVVKTAPTASSVHRRQQQGVASLKGGEGGGGGGGRGGGAKRMSSGVGKRGGGGAGKEQTFLDFGQRSLGQRILCPRCNLLYVCGSADDEARHASLCAKAARGVDFAGWKQERVRARFADDGGRVVEIRHGDPAPHLAKLREVESLMDADMGFAPGARDETVPLVGGGGGDAGCGAGAGVGSARKKKQAVHAFLYVRERRVLGCVVAERIENARRAVLLPPVPEAKQPAEPASEVGEGAASNGKGAPAAAMDMSGFVLSASGIVSSSSRCGVSEGQPSAAVGQAAVDSAAAEGSAATEASTARGSDVSVCQERGAAVVLSVAGGHAHRRHGEGAPRADDGDDVPAASAAAPAAPGKPSPPPVAPLTPSRPGNTALPPPPPSSRGGDNGGSVISRGATVAAGSRPPPSVAQGVGDGDAGQAATAGAAVPVRKKETPKGGSGGAAGSSAAAASSSSGRSSRRGPSKGVDGAKKNSGTTALERFWLPRGGGEEPSVAPPPLSAPASSISSPSAAAAAAAPSRAPEKQTAARAIPDRLEGHANGKGAGGVIVEDLPAGDVAGGQPPGAGAAVTRPEARTSSVTVAASAQNHPCRGSSSGSGSDCRDLRAWTAGTAAPSASPSPGGGGASGRDARAAEGAGAAGGSGNETPFPVEDPAYGAAATSGSEKKTRSPVKDPVCDGGGGGGGGTSWGGAAPDAASEKPRAVSEARAGAAVEGRGRGKAGGLLTSAAGVPAKAGPATKAKATFVRASPWSRLPVVMLAPATAAVAEPTMPEPAPMPQNLDGDAALVGAEEGQSPPQKGAATAAAAAAVEQGACESCPRDDNRGAEPEFFDHPSIGPLAAGEGDGTGEVDRVSDGGRRPLQPEGPKHEADVLPLPPAAAGARNSPKNSEAAESLGEGVRSREVGRAHGGGGIDGSSGSSDGGSSTSPFLSAAASARDEEQRNGGPPPTPTRRLSPAGERRRPWSRSGSVESTSSADSGVSSPPEEDLREEEPLPELTCEEKEMPAVVGVLQVWVHEQCRRQGVATRLVDSVREKMVYGMPLRRDQIAFSQPTREGQAFATRYTGGKLLVY